MRKIKIKRVDTEYVKSGEKVYLADKPKRHIKDNELVRLTFPDGEFHIVSPVGGYEYEYDTCDMCYLHNIDRCCATDASKIHGYRSYVCLFQGRPVKSIDSIMENL